MLLDQVGQQVEPTLTSRGEGRRRDDAERVGVPRDSYGWSVDGELFSVSKDDLTTCDPATGECTTVAHGIQMPPKTAPEEICETYDGREQCYEQPGETWEARLKLGGRIYES